MACAFGFPEIIARCPWSSLSNSVRQQVFEPTKIASQHILIMQLLIHELENDGNSAVHIIMRLGRNYIEGRHDYRLTQRLGYSHIGGDHDIYELKLQHSSRIAIPDEFIHWACSSWPEIVSELQGRSGSIDSAIMTGIEGLEDHGALESLQNTVSTTKGITKATLANRHLRKSTLALLESRVGEIQDLFGLPEAVTLCKNAKLLKDVCLGRDAHVTQEVAKHLVTKEGSQVPRVLTKILAKYPAIQRSWKWH